MPQRRAHNPKVVGSNPTPATNEEAGKSRCASAGSLRSEAFYRFFSRIEPHIQVRRVEAA